MRIKRAEVTNFRALRNSSLDFDETTALLGENNCGKSAFLLAMNLFFESSPKIRDRDFSDNNTKEPINITVHFSDFTPYDVEEFQSYLLDDALVITRRFTYGGSDENGKYFISARVNPEFSECRNEGGKTEKRAVYKALREKYGESELPKEKNADEICVFYAVVFSLNKLNQRWDHFLFVNPSILSTSDLTYLAIRDDVINNSGEVFLNHRIDVMSLGHILQYFGHMTFDCM
jgi:predicted ATP-dependent endonuclease of OLD family